MSGSQPVSIPIEQYRRFYAEEIRAVAGLTQPRLVDAFATVPREKFLGEPPWQFAGELYLQRSAYQETREPRDMYHDVVVALKRERSLNNGLPSALAIWIAALEVVEGDAVYHVGCGTGYYTAILAEVVGPSGSVIAAEVEADLAERAAGSLRNYGHVSVRSGDGAGIDPGLCDRILINAGVTHPHAPWLQCLKEGGRMVMPLTVTMAPGLGKGLMVKITRRGEQFAAEVVSMVAIYSSTSVRDAAIEPQLSKAFESRELFKLKSVRMEAHDPVASCLFHGPAVCLSTEQGPTA
jgi:protein-L-isoaspartate(D-aspartate) O-methyltransferase